MARHEAPPNTFDAVVSDYVTGRARELIRQLDEMQAAGADFLTDTQVRQRANDRAAWMGAAAEILRELTRDA